MPFVSALSYCVFFVALASLIIWFYVLSTECTGLNTAVSALELDLAAKVKLQDESNSLRKSILKRKQTERAQKEHIKCLTYMAKELKDFPVQTGDLFVVQEMDVWSQRGIRVFVPSGKHELSIDLGRTLVSKSDVRSNDGEHFVKKFELPPASVCEFLLRLEAKKDKFVAKLSLVDSDGHRMFEEEVEFPRLEGEGGINGGGLGMRSGEYGYYPNQFRPLGPANDYSHLGNYDSTSELNLKWVEEGRRVFSFHCSIQSPESPRFVDANDADTIPPLLRRMGKDFDEVFEPLENKQYRIKPSAYGSFHW